VSNASCPLNFKRVDDNISRINALIISLLVLVYLYTAFVPIVFLIILDLSIKLFFEKRISPFTFLSQWIKKRLHLKDVFVDGGAKRLAGFFGLFLMLLLFGTHFLHSWSISLVVAAVYLLCSFLDILFGFCIGCKIYFLIKTLYPNFMR